MTPEPKPLAKAAVAVLIIAVLAGGLLQLTRPGYSVDEEFTVFAVRGIAAHGLPLLPSGLLYDRGLAYSYASWIIGVITGSELPAYRAISLACALLTLWLTFKLVARFVNGQAGLFAAVLVATSVPFWATATSARFYAPFLAANLATLLALSTFGTGTFGTGTLGTGTLGTGTLATGTHPLTPLGTIAFLSALSRWCHELAFLLALVPAVCWLLTRNNRRRWLYATIAVVGGLLVGQAVLLLLHSASPTSGETMVRRFFLWQVLNLFERPAERQYAIPLVVMVVAWVVAPTRAWIISVASLSLAAMILAFSIANATNSAPLSIALIRAVVSDGARYPLDMFWHIARTTPITLIHAIAGLLLRSIGAAREWPPAHRAAHALWIGWVLWFGVIESGITTNYLLMPQVFMAMAIAIDAFAILIATDAPARRVFSEPVRAAWPAVAGITLLITFDQWRGDGSLSAKLERARPTIAVAGIEDIRAGLQPNDRVVCTDELGCLMLLGRIDRWLALDDYVRERFLVRRPDAPVTGVYTGVPASFRPAHVFAADANGTQPDRIVVVDIFKEYPIGNSRSWLPKAIEEDGLQVTPLLETAQMRVLQISPPERAAVRQPSP